MSPEDPLATAETRSAVAELHEQLAWWAHHARPGLVRVRTRLDVGDAIVVDVADPHRTPELDRFTLTCRGTAIAATAGTLGRVRHTRTCRSHRDARAWILATLQLVGE